MNKARALARTLTDRRMTLACAESCSGGLASHLLTGISGASAFFRGGIIAYANDVKTGLLKVPAARIKRHGAVSRQVASAMAQGAQKALTADCAIALTGIAGPTGATPGKPVGLVFIAAATPRKTRVLRCRFKGNRQAVKRQAAEAAFQLLLSLLHQKKTRVSPGQRK